MIRLVIAVTLATALLGATQPALDDARTVRADELVRGDLEHARNAVESMVATDDPVPVSHLAARRVVSIRLPERSAASAPVEYAAIDPAESGGAFTYQLADGSKQQLTIDTPVRVAHRTDGELTVRPPSEPLVLRSAGTYRLAFDFVQLNGRPTVLVHPLDADV